MTATPTRSWLALADHYLDLGLLAAARALLQRQLTAANASVEVHVRLMQLELAAGNDQRALHHAEEVVRRMDAVPAVARSAVVATLAHVSTMCGCRQRAREACRQLARDPERQLEARVGLARLAADTGDYAQAEKLLCEALSLLDSGTQRDVQRLCQVAGSCGSAQALLTALLDHEPTPRVSLALALLGAETGASRAQVEKWLTEAGELSLARFLLALRLASRRGADPIARERAERLLEGLLENPDPEVPATDAALLLASIRDDAGATVASAGTLYQQALRRNPKEALGYNNLGVVALHQGQMAEAAWRFGQALAVDADYQLGFQNLARVLVACGAPDQLAALLVRVRDAGMTWAALPRLLFAVAEVAREDVQHGIASRGHQFKNLLGVLGTRARSLSRRLPVEQREAALDLAARLSAAYDDWATFLRTVQEETGLWEPACINRLVTDAVTAVGGEVELVLADGRIDVAALPAQLREALVNVLRNGFEAQPAGERLYVQTERSADGRQVIVRCRDRGGGIAAADLRRLFVPGFTTKEGGSGLGLVIVERVLRGHGGRLEIDSMVGRGTEVRLVLPVLLESKMHHGMLRAPIARIAGSATAQELVSER